MSKICGFNKVLGMRLLNAVALLFAAASSACVAWVANQAGAVKGEPAIEDYATIEAYIGPEETPVYAFGYTFVYGVGPDLQPGAALQEGNTKPVVKFKPKKSWEIQHNFCGSTPAREPKTMWNDDQPMLPVHLIDGDPETAWSSRGGTVPDRQPEWIRIDLPAESVVSAVALVCSKVGPSINGGLKVGKALPGDVTIKLSRDARQWEAVYQNKTFSGPDSGPTVIKFDPRPAKQIWILSENLPAKVGFWGHSFSIGEVEVHDPQGNNLALLARGAGVQVSSTHYGYGMDRFTQDLLWPIQYDLGFKWLRVGYDMGTYLWSYVEREKGKLEIDRRSDECITEAVNAGMNVILCLDKGNWLYHDPPRKVDWKKARTREMMETYYDHQGWPTQSEKLLQGYLKYVEYMVRHFKGRVAYYEICNEWQGIGLENYMKLVKATIPAIKKADPNARVMLGSTGGFDRGSILACLGKEPAINVLGGKLIADGAIVAIAKGLKEQDVTVSVDAQADTEAGIALRLKDGRNYLLANYAPQSNSIYFHEVVDGNWGGMHAQATAKGLGPNLHLVAKIQGSTATLTVSDGTKTVTTSHTVQSFKDAGAAGVFHNVGARQAFDNFQVTGAQGQTILADQFQQPDGKAAGWEIAFPMGGRMMFEKGLGPQLDAIGWHPFYQTDPDSPDFRNYKRAFEEFKKDCAELGFKGQYAATEWTWAAPYPGAAPWCSEMQKAKYSAQLMTAHCGMDIISLYNETFQTGRIDWDCNLVRNAFSVDPISPAQPQPVYYVFRNISTVVDGFKGAEFPVLFSGEKQFDRYTFKRDGGELMFAAWIPGKTKDGIVESRSDVTLPGLEAKRATVYDIFNGTEQELNFTCEDGVTSLKGMLIKDYPTFVRLAR